MDKIDKLLDKYFEGETSLEEEDKLRRYFLQPNIEERHKAYRPMFNFFSEERSAANPQKKKNFYTIYTWIGVAASILLLIGVWSKVYNPVKKEVHSLVYVDGKKITDTKIFNIEVLNSIENISGVDEDVMTTQIDILDSFTE